MRAITISKKKFSELQPLDLPQEVKNTEAKMYDFIYQGNREVLKRLYFSNGELFGSKLYTIQKLSDNKEYLPESFIIPNSLVSVSSDIVGFTIPYVQGINLETILKSYNLELKEKIYYLKRIGEVLEQLKHIREYTPLNNIFINDLQESNIIVNPNNRSISIIDLDSCKIGTNSAFPSRYMLNSSLITRSNSTKYIKNENPKVNEGLFIANANSDIYCYIMIILNYLFGSNVSRMDDNTFYEYLNYLYSLGFNRELLDCFEKILRYEDNENPLYYLDSITYEQLGRAKENVYKLKKH